MPVFRKKRIDPRKGSTITIPGSLWEEIDQVVAEVGHRSRNEFAEEAFEWALAEYRKEKAQAAEAAASAAEPPQPSKRGRAK